MVQTHGCYWYKLDWIGLSGICICTTLYILMHAGACLLSRGFLCVDADIMIRRV